MPADSDLANDRTKKRRIEESEQLGDDEEEEEEESEDEAEKQTTDDKYDDESRDLVIISSDNVRFYVQKFYVQAASAVFRDMIENCTSDPAELQLTDDDIEDACIVRLFLDVACEPKSVDLDSISCFDVFALLDFCSKYDCSAVLNTIKLLVSRPLAGRRPAHTHRFYYACGLDDAETAHRLLPIAALGKWRDCQQQGPAAGIAKASCLDLTATSIQWLDRLPRKYFFALLRASRLRTRQPQGTWQEVADDFKEQVRLQELDSAAT